ncbi:MAG TPA: ion channel, partial [bacterium]|nr:ion channel [bacterium]
GLAYFWCGPETLEGIRRDTLLHHFGDCFFFSVQTLTTIGYGHISPVGFAANILVTLEAFLGVSSLAVITGLFYARFARPTARVLFSDVAVIGKHDGVPSFVFRMANERLNQIVDANVEVHLIRDETTAEGETYRNFYDLKLDRKHSPVFHMSWTVLHEITPDSPFHGLTAKEMKDAEVEILITFAGIDDTIYAPIHARFSYTADEIVWDKRFADILTRAEDGRIHVDLDRMHETAPIADPTANL